MAVLLTPKVLAKIGIAGIINPKPNATKKATVVRTGTSFGRSVKGELNFFKIIRLPHWRRLHEQQHNLRHFEVVSHVRRAQRGKLEPSLVLPK